MEDALSQQGYLARWGLTECFMSYMSQHHLTFMIFECAHSMVAHSTNFAISTPGTVTLQAVSFKGCEDSRHQCL